jgi:general transcription factor 3C polypeptide 5 (transcription factor C subunit 1)
MNSLLRVEFPGYVQHPDRALSLLGGPSHLYSQFSNPNPVLHFSFRPGDPLSHRVSSESVVDPCILIRIRVIRRYRATASGRELISTEFLPIIIGSSVHLHAFRKPSDFQFLPALESPLHDSTVVLPPDVQQSFLYLPPPIFIHNNKYDAQYIQKRIFSSQRGESEKLWKDRAGWMVNQNDLIALENGPRPPKRFVDVRDDILTIFEELFEQRPIWTALAICDHLVRVQETRGDILELPEISATIFRALSCVAYHIRTGPYRVVWVKYGINPLRDPAYRMYQVVTVSLRSWDYAEELQKRIVRKSTKYISQKVGEVVPGMTWANALPDRLFFALQLCDLEHPLLTDILAQCEPSYSFASGWFRPEQIAAVRDFVMLKYQRMLIDPNAEKIAELIMADISSIEQVRQELAVKKPRKAPGETFDFELLNEVQGILGVDGGPGTEPIDALLEVVTRKACAISIDRVLSY